MAQFEFRCPQCGESIEADDSFSGQVAECPFCGKGIVVPRGMMKRECPRLRTSSIDTRNVPTNSSFEEDHDRENQSTRKRLVSHPILKWGIPAAVGTAVLLAVGYFALGYLAFQPKNQSSVMHGELVIDHKTCPMHNDVTAWLTKDIEIGHAYPLADMTVIQTIVKDGAIAGVLVKCKYQSDLNLNKEPAFIKTTNTYVDGENLPFSYYVCTGRFSYPTVTGTMKTVWAFEPMNPAICETRRKDAKVEQLAEEEQMRFETESRMIEERKAMAKTQLELEKQRQENDRKLAAQRLAAEQEVENARIAAEKEKVNAEKELLAAKRLAEQKTEEEKKRRYPEEQKRRAEYAAVKFSSLVFDWRNRIRVQNALLRLISSARVTAEMWDDLKLMQQEKNWLGMLGIAGGKKFDEYPDTDTIDNLIDSLNHHEFEVEIQWTNNLGDFGFFLTIFTTQSVLDTTPQPDETHAIQRSRTRYGTTQYRIDVPVQKISPSLEELKRRESSVDTFNGPKMICTGIRIPFRLGDWAIPWLYASEGDLFGVDMGSEVASRISALDDIIRKLKGLLENNRISHDKYENEVRKAKNNFNQSIETWMKTSTIRLGTNNPRINDMNSQMKGHVRPTRRDTTRPRSLPTGSLGTNGKLSL